MTSIFSKRKKAKDELPNHGYLFFDNLQVEYQCRTIGLIKEMKISSTQEGEVLPTEEEKLFNTLVTKREDLSNRLTWEDLYMMELLVSRHYPEDRLTREVWSLRMRYRAIVGSNEYDNYISAISSEPKAQVTIEDQRADIEYLLGEIYLRYAITPFQEAVRNTISKRITAAVILGIIAIIWIVYTQQTAQTQEVHRKSLTILLVLFVGAMGGLLSMQHRSQNVNNEGDLIDNTSEMMQSWSRIFMPTINGALFALLLYLIFAGGLVSGELFPILGDPQGAKDANQEMSMSMMFDETRPLKSQEYAKLIVWSFVAGFAERFVPDTLSRFVSTKDAGAKAKS